jgi:hypothetical protein
METINNITHTSESTFDAVQMMRDIRDRISLETTDMTFLQLKEYMQQKRSAHDNAARNSPITTQQ